MDLHEDALKKACTTIGHGATYQTCVMSDCHLQVTLLTISQRLSVLSICLSVIPLSIPRLRSCIPPNGKSRFKWLHGLNSTISPTSSILVAKVRLKSSDLPHSYSTLTSTQCLRPKTRHSPHGSPIAEVESSSDPQYHTYLSLHSHFT